MDHLVGQAGCAQAFGGFVPVQGDQLVEIPRLLRIVEEGTFAQLQLTGLPIQQGDRGLGEMLGAEVEVGQADFAVDHP